jgi:hypothetical protein
MTVTVAVELAGRWLRLVVADAELSPHLVGVDVQRFAAHLAAILTNALDGRPVADPWRGLGLSERQHRRVVDYLVGVLWAAGLPDERVTRVTRAVGG